MWLLTGLMSPRHPPGPYPARQPSRSTGSRFNPAGIRAMSQPGSSKPRSALVPRHPVLKSWKELTYDRARADRGIRRKETIMAQSHNAPNGADFPYGDNDIIIGVSAKDATRGFYGVLPAPTLPAELDPGLATALSVGLYYDGVRSAQSTANKAVKDKGDVAAAIRAHLASFKPDTDRSVNTIAAKRVEIARKMVATALEGRGLPANDANVDANLPTFMARRGAEINAAVLASIEAGYEVTKKTKGAAGATGGAVVEDL